MGFASGRVACHCSRCLPACTAPSFTFFVLIILHSLLSKVWQSPLLLPLRMAGRRQLQLEHLTTTTFFHTSPPPQQTPLHKRIDNGLLQQKRQRKKRRTRRCSAIATLRLSRWKRSSPCRSKPVYGATSTLPIPAAATITRWIRRLRSRVDQHHRS